LPSFTLSLSFPRRRESTPGERRLQPWHRPDLEPCLHGHADENEKDCGRKLDARLRGHDGKGAAMAVEARIWRQRRWTDGKKIG
ncbi:hypothetical protein, partial [Desulfogranum mediterraneum]|uniref:hypothetical protein n=1 Tax=Desulfogranum mediterraneum TaxID=160661 RepID=UPI001AC00680